MLVMSNREWFKYCLVWEKSSAAGFLDVKFRPLKSHEDIAVFSHAGCSNGSRPPMVYDPELQVMVDPVTRQPIYSKNKDMKLAKVTAGCKDCPKYDE